MNTSKKLLAVFAIGLSSLFACQAQAREPDAIIDLWDGFAPGETTAETGVKLPLRSTENPPATRIKNITKPRLFVYSPCEEKRTGTAVLIFPGGGYNYVVVDKEGSEVAAKFNKFGVAAFVVHYRTKPIVKHSQSNPILPAFSERPLQDGQRAISVIRSQASKWRVKPNRIGVLGFSAGGQTAALLATRFEARSYVIKTKREESPCKPDFAMLLYPWQLLDKKTNQLSKALTISDKTPPTFLVHAHDDGHSSLNSVAFYTALKKKGVAAELHIYNNGGHGNGVRPVKNSSFFTWTKRAEDWMQQQNLLSE